MIPQARLGFGCGSLMRESSSKKRVALLDAAFNNGITHFDVARMYGLGEAERELGHFLRGKRDQVTLTSKCGLDVTPSLKKIGALQSVIRPLLKWSPGLKSLVKRRFSQKMTQKSRLTNAFITHSLEKSLKELQTDYLDYFLLHEPDPELVHPDETLTCLKKLQQAGKIRQFGIAGFLEHTEPFKNQFPELSHVLQSNAIISAIPTSTDTLRITFSVVSQGLDWVQKFASTHPEKMAAIHKQTGDDIALQAFLIAMQDNPSGIVLFSTSQLTHLLKVAKLNDH